MYSIIFCALMLFFREIAVWISLELREIPESCRKTYRRFPLPWVERAAMAWEATSKKKATVDRSSRAPAYVSCNFVFQRLGNHWQTLRGPFSAVSTPVFASIYSFESSWRHLQDLHTFAPLRIQGVIEIRQTFCQTFFNHLLEWRWLRAA